MPSFGYDPSHIKRTLESTLPDSPRALLYLPSFKSFFGFFSGTTVLNTPFVYSTTSSPTPTPITLNCYIY